MVTWFRSSFTVQQSDYCPEFLRCCIRVFPDQPDTDGSHTYTVPQGTEEMASWRARALRQYSVSYFDAPGNDAPIRYAHNRDAVVNPTRVQSWELDALGNWDTSTLDGVGDVRV